MVTKRNKDLGFTLTELMVVVVILGVLAAVSSPLFSKDNNAHKGKQFAREVAQILQRSRFQAMGDRANIHVQFYRGQLQMHREDPPGTFTLIGSLASPLPEGTATLAIWDLLPDGATLPTGQSTNLTGPLENPRLLGDTNDLVFTPLGGTLNNGSFVVYIRNELLPAGHPDAGFSIGVTGLTGFVTTRSQVPLP